ncbi:hypothetical protein Tco_1323921 [Tanacetum coccineum]
METVHARFDEIPEIACDPLRIEPTLNQKSFRQISSELLPIHRSDNNRRMSHNFTATLHPQDGIPSPVYDFTTPIIRVVESTPDTPLVSQESSATILLPSVSNTVIDD